MKLFQNKFAHRPLTQDIHKYRVSRNRSH